MNEMELQKLLSSAQFKFAKTMPWLPHYYTLKDTWDSEKFKEAVVAIRTLGESRKFGKRQFIYYDFNGNTYWTMGDTLENTILINRAVRAAE